MQKPRKQQNKQAVSMHRLHRIRTFIPPIQKACTKHRKSMFFTSKIDVYKKIKKSLIKFKKPIDFSLFE